VLAASCVEPESPGSLTGSGVNASASSVAGAVTWDPSAVKQTIDGFGGSNAWHSLPSDGATSDKLVKLLFSPTEGAGLTLLRNRIPFRESTTYDDKFLAKDSAGKYTFTKDTEHKTFTLNWTTWDLSGTKSLFAKAKVYSPEIRGFSTPWTPPNNAVDQWKVNGTVSGNTIGGTSGTIATWPDIGGELDPAHYQDYADVLADYAKDFQAKMGYPLTALSIQNEPNWLPKTYESCWWTADQFKAFLPYLSSAWTAKGVTTPVMAPEGAQFSESLIVPSLSDPATAALVSIVGVHQYDSNASSGKLASSWLATTKGANKKLWVTEVSSSGGNPPTSIADGLWTAQLVHSDMTTAETNAFCFWWLWDNDSPTNKGSLVGVSGTTVVAYKRLFTLGQFSRFVRPGWVRVSATTEPVPGVLVSAYKDPASSKFAVVFINTATGTSIALKGSSAFASAKLYRTSATEDLKEIGAFTTSGSTLNVPLTGQSVTTVYGTLVP